MKRFLAAAIVAAMIFSLTACSGGAPSTGSNGSGNNSGNESQNAQGVTDSSVKVANSIAVSGAYAPVGIPFKMGIEAYFKMVNEGGGISGRTIEYIHKDDEFSPELGKAAMEQFVNDDKVFAIVGHFGTPVVAATLEDLKEIGIPTVYYATGIAQLYQAKAEGTNRSSLPLQPIYSTEGEVMIAYAKGHFNASKIGVVYTNDDAGKSLYEGIERAAKDQGIQLVVESIQAGATDATAQVTKLKDCDIILGAMIQATLPVLIKEMEKQDIMTPVLTTYVNQSASMTEANGEHVQKLMHAEQAGIYALAWVNLDTTDSEYQNFDKYMRSLGAVDGDINSYSMTGWIAASVFCQGLERVGDQPLTWESYIDAMESEPIRNPFGGTVDFSDGKRFGTAEMSLSRMDDKEAVGWREVLPIRSIDDILSSN